jgi:hypothetical protein
MTLFNNGENGATGPKQTKIKLSIMKNKVFNKLRCKGVENSLTVINAASAGFNAASVAPQRMSYSDVNITMQFLLQGDDTVCQLLVANQPLNIAFQKQYSKTISTTNTRPDHDQNITEQTEKEKTNEQKQKPT